MIPVKQYDRAIAFFKKLTTEHPSAANAHLNYGFAYVDKIPDAISVPSQAVFTRDGKPVVYVAEDGTYRAVNVEVLARNPDEVAVKGIPAASNVALVEPVKDKTK